MAVEATPVHAAVSDAIVIRRGFEDFGVIAIHPLREPLPEPELLYNVISDAVAEAHDRAQEAEAVAANYMAQLRALGSPGQVTSQTPGQTTGDQEIRHVNYGGER